MKSVPPRSVRKFAASMAALGVVPTALAQQAGQDLVLAFDDGAAIPIDGWTSLAIAAVLAVFALVALRRRGASRFAQWCVLATIGGTLALTADLRDSEAIAPTYTINLLASPAKVAVPPPGPVTVLVRVNNTLGKPTIIKSITLSSGVYVISGNDCPVGASFAPAATCYITLDSGVS